MTHSQSFFFPSDLGKNLGAIIYSRPLLIFCMALAIGSPFTSYSMGEQFTGLECDVTDKKLDCDNDGTLNGEDIAPLDPCTGGKNPPADNDCDGDGVTIGQGDSDDYDFCTPNPQPACENYNPHQMEIEEIDIEEEEEEEIDFEEDLVVVESQGVVAIVNNPCPTEVADYGDCDGDGTPNNLDEDPFDPCIGGTNSLGTNDCDGDGVTVDQGDTDDYDFCVPITQSGCESSSPLEEEFDVDIVENSGISAQVNTVFDCNDALDPTDCDGDGTPNNRDEAPYDPCTGGTKTLDTNDCDGDGVTVGQGDTDDYDFCVPIAQPGCESSSPLEEEFENFDVDIVDNQGISAEINTLFDCSDALDPADCDGDGTPNNRDEAPYDPCTGGTKTLDTNDCDGDGVTVGQGDTDDYDFCMPVPRPECNSSVVTQTVLIAPCVDEPNCYLTVAVKALLQGAYDVDNPAIMRDDLRALNLLPTNEPYKDLTIYDGDPIPFKTVGEGGEIVEKKVLAITGDNAIVDWVFVQLHDENNPEKIVATRSALIQRDGDIVDIDGVSPLKFPIAPGKYYLSVRHRNHLGVMTKTAEILSKDITKSIDFSNINTPTYTLEDSRKKSNHALRRIDDLNYLWGGNSNGDWATIYQGPGLDQTKVFYDIFVDDKNKGPDGFPNYNYIKRGYTISDSNMDGEVRYQGPDNDVDDLQFFNIILHPDNPGFFSNKIIYEQIPRKNEE